MGNVRSKFGRKKEARSATSVARGEAVALPAKQAKTTDLGTILASYANLSLDTLFALREELVTISGMSPYPVNKNTPITSTVGCAGLTYETAAQLLLIQESPALKAGGLWAIGSYLVYNSYSYTSTPHETVRLPDGRQLDRMHLFLEAIDLDPTFGDPYNDLVTCCLTQSTMQLHDGRILNKKELVIQALHYNHHHVIYANLAYLIDRDEIVTLLDGRSLNKLQLLVEAHRLNPSLSSYFYDATRLMKPADSWARHMHTFFNQAGRHTNPLFATLLMGLQRLEDTGVLLQSHQSMLEDMLEGWTWADSYHQL